MIAQLEEKRGQVERGLQGAGGGVRWVGKAVAAAETALALILNPPTETVPVDSRDGIAAVIGKGGETIAQLQRETGARLDITGAFPYHP